jgi:hypothetical protein
MMDESRQRSLSRVLDQLEEAIEGDSISIREIVDKLGQKSFASLMLLFSLISTSPASAIPGVTAVVAVIVFLLVVQMLVGRDHVWLPDFVMKRELEAKKLNKGINWMRKPVGFVEKFLKKRLGFLFHRPWVYLPLLLIMGLTMFMPFMELIPTSGSIASAVIALFAAGMLTRDGALLIAALVPLLGLPLLAWQLGFAG